MFKVKKPFNTTTQRFGAGDEVPESTDLNPHTADSLVAGGFLAASEKSAAKPKAKA